MPHKHRVQPGECLSLIAQRHGFARWQTLYDHPDNADLRKARPDPNVLFPGDVVVVPDREEKSVEAPTGKNARFRVKIARKELRLVIEDHAGEPLGDEPYWLEIGDDVREGTTDGRGRIEERVPQGATGGVLIIAGRVLRLRFGNLNPARADTPDRGVSGAQARLANLGYAVTVDGKLGPRTRAALALFKAEAGMPVDGELDDAVLAKLVDRHGC